GRSRTWSPMRTTARGCWWNGRTMPNGRFSSGKSLSSTTGTQADISEVAAPRLIALDRLEQRLEIPFAESAGAAPLDELEEQRRSIGDRLGEDLQQVSLVIAVGEDVRGAQRVPRQVEAGEPLTGLVVVGVRHLHEPNAALAQRVHRRHDVVGAQRDVLHAGPVVAVEILLHLALAQPFGRFVQRHDALAAVPDDGRDERRILGADLALVEMQQL